MNTQQRILYRSRYTRNFDNGFDKFLQDMQDLGPCVFISPDKSVVMTLNGSYLNIFVWDNVRNEYTCHECSSRSDVTSNYELTLYQIDQWTKEQYVYFMRSWFDIVIDPNTLD